MTLYLRELYALVPYQSLSTYNINFGSMLNYNIAKRIQEIKEVDLKEYFVWFAPRDGKPYIDLLLQKIYHPTEEDNQKDKILRLSSLR